MSATKVLISKLSLRNIRGGLLLAAFLAGSNLASASNSDPTGSNPIGSESIGITTSEIDSDSDSAADDSTKVLVQESGEELAELKAQQEELARRIDLVAGELERIELGKVAPEANQSRYGMGPAASKIYNTLEGLSIGGYGELIYQNFRNSRSSEADFLRGVLYVGYKFNDKWLLNTEIEIEHVDEIFLEFAYLDYLARPEFNARIGLLLIPMGFVNELHEPTTFFSVKRPMIETVIMPSTWRENGVGVFGSVGPLSYKSYVVAGFDGQDFAAGGLRGGRQKGARSKADDFAFVTRLDYSPQPGMLFGGSFYYGNAGQDTQFEQASTAIVELPSVRTQIAEAHIQLEAKGARFRGLVVQADLGDTAELNNALELTGAASVGKELQGGYLELGYDVMSAINPASGQSVSPFVRWESYDTQADVADGFLSDPKNDVQITTYGVAWQPLPNVILKADYQNVNNGAHNGVNQFNLGMGYIF